MVQENERKDNKIIVKGKEYEVVSFINIVSGRFVVYTDGKMSDNNHVILYISHISEENNKIIFDEVSDEELKQVIKKIKERLVNHG